MTVVKPVEDTEWQLPPTSKNDSRTNGLEVQADTTDISTADFLAYMPMHNYIFAPTGELWPGASVNARCAAPRAPDGSRATKRVSHARKGGEVEFEDVPMSPTEWIDQHRPVEQMTWAPGEPMVIADRLVSGGGYIDRPGCSCFNLYRPPRPLAGDPRRAGRWTDHIRKVFPDDADHIIRWLGHRVQRPGDKINHALVLGGGQGIGKDTILEAVKHAVGPWNCADISPVQALQRFNSYIKSVMLRVNEGRDLGDVDRYAFYDHLKALTAAPPDVLRCDEKHIREHMVMNVTGVIITTNHKTDGIYLPADDRRHYVAWSDLTNEDFAPDYWNSLWSWYRSGGIGHVAAYLASLDLSDFDAKAPPPKTAAFRAIVDANRAPEDGELADVLDRLNNPKAVTITTLTLFAEDLFRDWLRDRRNRRQIPHRMEAAGYVPVRNDGAADGLWKIDGKRQAVYGRREMAVRDRLAAVSTLARGGQ